MAFNFALRFVAMIAIQFFALYGLVIDEKIGAKGIFEAAWLAVWIGIYAGIFLYLYIEAY